MSVYMIIEAVIHDLDRFAAYADATIKLVVKYGGRYRVLGGSKTFLEGDWGETKIVISEWPSMEAAEQFWTSDDYAQAKKLRAGIADCKVMLSDTLSDEQWAGIAQATEVED